MSVWARQSLCGVAADPPLLTSRRRLVEDTRGILGRMHTLAAVGTFATVALGTYILLTAILLLINFGTGGGISCYRVCTPFQDFTADAAPIPVIGSSPLR